MLNDHPLFSCKGFNVADVYIHKFVMYFGHVRLNLGCIYLQVMGYCRFLRAAKMPEDMYKIIIEHHAAQS